jgi:hypothetical protein
MTELNGFAAETLASLLRKHPDWETHASVRSGELSVSVPAPQGSQAGHLVVQTNRGDLWVRFAPPYTGSLVDGHREMKRVIDALLADEIVFVTIAQGKKWVETTLADPGKKIKLKTGQTARVISWSGVHDKVLKASRRK